MGQRQRDLVVIGSGAAGLSAAATAAQAGLNVTVLESEDVVGGVSRLSRGYLVGYGTRQQAAAGLDATPEKMYREYLLLNRWEVDAAPVRSFAEAAGQSIDWLVDLGIEFEDRLRVSGHEEVPQGHQPVGFGADVIDKLHATCIQLGVEILLGCRVDHLLVEDGRVVGAASGEDSFRTSHVLVASGGFGHNPDAMRRWFPDAMVHEDLTFYAGENRATGSRGDALQFAEQVDAQVVGANWGLRFMTPGFNRTMEALWPAWLVVVDPAGRRIMREDAHYGAIDYLVKARKLDRVYGIFNDATLRREGIPASLGDPDGAYRVNFSPETIDRFVAAGRVSKAATVEALAAAAGLPVTQLAGTVRRYNRDVSDGVDSEYCKDPVYFQPFDSGPFYAVELYPACVVTTGTGLRIDDRARVLNASAAAIPGLLAAGECVGGVVGPVYASSGNAFTSAVAIGRIAALTAARERAEER